MAVTKINFDAPVGWTLDDYKSLNNALRDVLDDYLQGGKSQVDSYLSEVEEYNAEHSTNVKYHPKYSNYTIE